jgi:hypothetical protein
LAAELPEWPQETIDDSDWLYRRLPPIFVKPDGRISDKLFMPNSEATAVCIEVGPVYSKANMSGTGPYFRKPL